MIKFGTDGWRGIIAKDFTFENVNIVAVAASKYIAEITPGGKRSSCVIGYDTRFLSRQFALEVAKVFAAQGIVVHLTETYSSTPQVSFHTKQKTTTLGIIITASHNPAIYNGFKVKGNFGGPATPEMIERLEHHVAAMEKKLTPVKTREIDEYIESRQVRLFNAKESYIRYIKKKIDIDLIRNSGIKIVYDPMHGAGIQTMKDILPDVLEIHGEYNPSFGDLDHPEPIAECLLDLSDAVRLKKRDIGIATDGDADRLGVVDEDGNYVDPHKVFMILLKYLYEVKKKRGAVAKTVSLTSMVDMYCKTKKIEMLETPVGFKYISKLMNEGKILIGGEESGGMGTLLHVPERDGIFNALLLLEVMAVRKKSLKELCSELDKEFGMHRYLRRDVYVTESQKKAIINACKKMPGQLGRYKVNEIDTKDGFKFFIDSGWLLIRPSGTEPLFRFYAEAGSYSVVNELLDAGMKLK